MFGRGRILNGEDGFWRIQTRISVRSSSFYQLDGRRVVDADQHVFRMSIDG